MSKQAQKWMMIATALVVFGLILVVTVMSAYSWDFAKLSAVKYETNTYEVSEDFSNLSINTETADILFAPSDDGKCRVVCYEAANERHSVTVQNGTLTINAQNERKWYEYIGAGIGAPKITVYLPGREYGSLFIRESTGDIEIPKGFQFNDMDISLSTGDVKAFASASEWMKIKTTTGDIRVENASANRLDLSVSTGRVAVSDVTCEGDIKIDVATSKADVTNVRCKSLVSSGSTGGISMENVIATEKLSVERSTGDVRLEGCDAAEIFIKTKTGDVTGSLLSEKVFITQTKTGRVDVPKTTTGGKCEVNTATGDIRLGIQ